MQDRNLLNVRTRDEINNRPLYCSARSLGCQLGNYGNDVLGSLEGSPPPSLGGLSSFSEAPSLVGKFKPELQVYQQNQIKQKDFISTYSQRHL